MTPQERLDQINQTLEAVRSGWPFFLAVLQERIDAHTVDLIGQDNEQTRGRIKALTELKDLPETLSHERDGIGDGLAE